MHPCLMDKLQHLGCGHTKFKGFHGGAGFLPSTVCFINHPLLRHFTILFLFLIQMSVSCACRTQLFLPSLCILTYLLHCQELLIGDANFQPEDLLKLHRWQIVPAETLNRWSNQQIESYDLDGNFWGLKGQYKGDYSVESEALLNSRFLIFKFNLSMCFIVY